MFFHLTIETLQLAKIAEVQLDIVSKGREHGMLVNSSSAIGILSPDCTMRILAALFPYRVLK